MVSGRLQCLGSVQHLKGRFGASYEVEVRCAEGRGCEALTHCLRVVCGSTLEESHGDFFRLKVGAGPQLDLAATFSVLETSKSQGLLADYSVSQATLEQIFIRFAKEQEEEPVAVGPVGATNTTTVITTTTTAAAITTVQNYTPDVVSDEGV